MYNYHNELEPKINAMPQRSYYIPFLSVIKLLKKAEKSI